MSKLDLEEKAILAAFGKGELKPVKNNTARTAIHIDSYWVERQLQVVETPEEILGQG